MLASLKASSPMRKTVYRKQPCTCTHCKSIHHPERNEFREKLRNPCKFPGCKCRDYKPAPKKQ
jgi:hypothetical protein